LARRNAAHWVTGLRSAPISIGSSGHRSRTSNTKPTRRSLAAMIPGMATVSGVLVASTTSGWTRVARVLAPTANSTNEAIRRR
jgi:hypothetical protein